MTEAGEPLEHILVAVRWEPAFVPRPWVFYLVNDGDSPIEDARLDEVGYEWGDSYSLHPNPSGAMGSLAPRSFRRIWQEGDDAAEVNPWLVLEVTVDSTTYRLMYEFPKLYHRGQLVELPLVGGQGVLRRGTTCTRE